MSEEKIDVIYKLFKDRDKKGLCDLRTDIHTKLQELNGNIYDLSIDAKGAEILEKSDECSRLQKEISNMDIAKQELEKLDGLIVKLINLLK